MQKESIIIASLARTPLGNFQGALTPLSATELGAQAMSHAITRAGLTPADIHEVIMGCVLPAGLGQAPARQAAIHAGMSASTPCSTVNKVCGSGMKAIMMVHAELMQGDADIMMAGGMESMTHAPYLLKKARSGYRLGHGELYDHMMLDGLEDAYDKGTPMGVFAETCAKEFKISREAQDAYSLTSFERAINAAKSGYFKHEIAPVTIKNKKGDVIISEDEHPLSVDFKKMSSLKPVFKTDGTITAGNSSCIADGAAALVLMREDTAKNRKIKPLATIIGYSSYAASPKDFPTAPIHATKTLLEKLNWSVESVDLFEVNEAFAVVTLAFMQALHLPHEKVNIHGGACAMGHPIGATGARIVATLINALATHKLKRGIATLCIGGGEATAVAIEMY